MCPSVHRDRRRPVQAEAPSHRAHLVARLRTGPCPALAPAAAERHDLAQESIARALAGAAVEPLFPEARQALAQATGAERGPLGVLLDYLRIELPAELDPLQWMARLHHVPAVCEVYEEGAPTVPAALGAPDAGEGRCHDRQRYLDPAPMGIDAEQAWSKAGGTGAGVGLIDVEQGWVLEHQGLPPGIELLTGRNKRFFGHGTAVLGIVAAVDEGRGVVGIAPGIDRLNVVSQWRSEEHFCTARALFAAAANLRPGDILLVEAQTTCSQVPGLFPVEIEPAAQAVIRWAVARGITVVEAAGNGNLCLDAFDHPTWGCALERSSGAIVVGAATAGTEHARLPGSNFGRRVDCHAWGEWVATTGDGVDSRETTRFTERFSGTSAAAAIVAGTAVVVQGVAKAHRGTPLSPAAVRALFRDPAAGTPSVKPADDLVGAMPDLKKMVPRIREVDRDAL